MAKSEVAQLRGRPRDREKDEAIRKATWLLLSRDGYDNLTFDAVAQLAGVSRTTLYRRFSNKPDLVKSAVYQTLASMDVEPVPEGAQFESLLAMARNTKSFTHGDSGRAVLTILESSNRNRDLAAGMDELKNGRFLGKALQDYCPSADMELIELAISCWAGTMLIYQAVRGRTLSPRGVEAVVSAAIQILSTPADDADAG